MSLRFTTFIVWTTLGEIIFQAEIFSLEIWQQLELTSSSFTKTISDSLEVTFLTHTSSAHFQRPFLNFPLKRISKSFCRYKNHSKLRKPPSTEFY